MKTVKAIWKWFDTPNMARALARVLTVVLVLFTLGVVCLGMLIPEVNFAILSCMLVTILYTVIDDDDNSDRDDCDGDDEN